VTLARFAKRRDSNESAIFDALRKAGAVVYALDRPVDALVGWNGRWVVLEIKRPKGAVGERQAAFMDDCKAKHLPAMVVRTPEDALQAIGAIR
jgi:hypothetical protein